MLFRSYFIGVWDAVAAIGWQRFFPDWAYDRHFTSDVQYARHLQSIDEGRKDFKRVPWGGSGTVKWPDRQGEPEQFDQIWFAGNHADIGGSYPENESRLSDIALAWMVEFITDKIPEAGRVIVSADQARKVPGTGGDPIKVVEQAGVTMLDQRGGAAARHLAFGRDEARRGPRGAPRPAPAAARPPYDP